LILSQVLDLLVGRARFERATNGLKVRLPARLPRLMEVNKII